MMERLVSFVCLFYIVTARPIVIGHRGAPGYRPEHTFDSYGLAIDYGADYIEIDLQPTKDNELSMHTSIACIPNKFAVAIHDHSLGVATDVAQHPEFADRFSWKVKYGKNESGWWVEDFLLSEIRTLRLKQVIPFRDQDFNWLYNIPTFSEILQFLIAKQRTINRQVGLVVELKDPAYFASLGLPMERNILSTLQEYNYSISEPQPSKLIIQSFEPASMQFVRSISNVTIVQLINVPTDFVGPTNETFAQLLEQLPMIATYAWGIGPWKNEIVPQMNSTGGSGGTSLGEYTKLVHDAHALGLKVFAWTFRSDPFYLNDAYHGSWEEEYFHFMRVGLDGFISDFPNNAIAALNAYSEQNQDSTQLAREFAITVGIFVALLLGLSICAVALYKKPPPPAQEDTQPLTEKSPPPKYG